jgi:hypothetical protein
VSALSALDTSACARRLIAPEQARLAARHIRRRTVWRDERGSILGRAARSWLPWVTDPVGVNCRQRKLGGWRVGSPFTS